MKTLLKYLWLLPALYVAYMFGNKIVEGLSHSEEFQNIISLIPFLKPYAYMLTPLVGIWDCLVGVALILNPFTIKNLKLQNILFIWCIIWPFVPSSIRYFGGIADFEIVEVLSISFSTILAYTLWCKYSKSN